MSLRLSGNPRGVYEALNIASDRFYNTSLPALTKDATAGRFGANQRILENNSYVPLSLPEIAELMYIARNKEALPFKDENRFWAWTDTVDGLKRGASNSKPLATETELEFDKESGDCKIYSKGALAYQGRLLKRDFDFTDTYNHLGDLNDSAIEALFGPDVASSLSDFVTFELKPQEGKSRINVIISGIGVTVSNWPTDKAVMIGKRDLREFSGAIYSEQDEKTLSECRNPKNKVTPVLECPSRMPNTQEAIELLGLYQSSEIDVFGRGFGALAILSLPQQPSTLAGWENAQVERGAVLPIAARFKKEGDSLEIYPDAGEFEYYDGRSGRGNGFLSGLIVPENTETALKIRNPKFGKHPPGYGKGAFGKPVPLKEFGKELSIALGIEPGSELEDRFSVYIEKSDLPERDCAKALSIVPYADPKEGPGTRFMILAARDDWDILLEVAN